MWQEKIYSAYVVRFFHAVKGSSRTKVGGVPPETFIIVFIHKDDGVAEFSVYQRSNDRTACFL